MTNTGIIIKSSDAGLNWDTTSVNHSIIHINFINDSVGVALSFDSTIFKTTNSGTSWNSQIIPGMNIIESSKLSFVNDSCWVINGDKETIITNDYGLSWAKQPSKYFIDLAVLSDSVFIAARETNNIEIYKSFDQGNSWVLVDSIIKQQGGSLVCMNFPDINTGYLSGQFMMYKTIDGGNNWVNQHATLPATIFGDWINDLYFVSADTGFAVGVGQFYNTFNGGNTIIGISEHTLKNKLRVYPNPIRNQFTLNSKSKKALTFELYNVLGKAINFSFTRTRDEYLFTLGDLPKGIYLLQVNDGIEQTSIKLIKDE